MLNFFKKYKTYIVITISIIIITFLSLKINKKSVSTNIKISNDKSSKTKNIPPNTNVFEVNSTHVKISRNGKTLSEIPIATLKPKITKLANIYGKSLKKFEYEISIRSQNSYWIDLILQEYGINPDLSTKEKFCKLRKLTNNCNTGFNECPIECKD